MHPVPPTRMLMGREKGVKKRKLGRGEGKREER